MKYLNIALETIRELLSRAVATLARQLREHTGNRQQLELKDKGRPGQRVKTPSLPLMGPSE